MCAHTPRHRPEKVDLVVQEIAGSVMSEEGMIHTMIDVAARFLKAPHDPRSYIPLRVQTFAAPASYFGHHHVDKLAPEYVRLHLESFIAGNEIAGDARSMRTLRAKRYSLREMHSQMTGVGEGRPVDDPDGAHALDGR